MPFRHYRPETRTLLGAQLVFNLGFYAVVPFLAGAMGRDYGMDAAAIGLVLGARTFSQQGMFLAGGILADRWGPRRAILTGCLIRILGYATLAAASDFTLFLLGAVLTGAGGALFSPALESQLSQADAGAPAGGKKGRRSVFVWLAITGEIGAVLGPVLGSALLGWGFDAALAAGIAVFTAVTILLWYRLPAAPDRVAAGRAAADRAAADRAAPERTAADSTQGPEPDLEEPGHAVARPALECLRNRRFVVFCMFASMNMLAYNQLYFAVPVELDRRGLDGAWLGALFLLASVLTLLLQLPAAAAAQRLGPGRTLSAGFVLLAAAFALTATTAVHPGTSGSSLAPMAGAVAVLILGRMLLTPTILSLIPAFVPAGGPVPRRGAYFGLSATCGGIAVLAGNALLGRLLDLTDRHHWWPGIPWVPLVLLALLAAAALPPVLRGHRTGSNAAPATTAAGPSRNA
ncbi:MFS transporter [Zafaria cholistanensis]|uniref:MFS transporter n=1 Tax=Zafaria cholistanensis TaxID=1682741 RepID=A0A5A7NSZ5_9MICC|nr:MFS transporter [Zafaria cholistanensis]GER23017.1 MFS transporter [Zafaria cholistanensis]